MAPPTVEQLCTAIEELCIGGATAAAADEGDELEERAALLEQRAGELLAFSEEFQGLAAQRRPGPVLQNGPPAPPAAEERGEVKGAEAPASLKEGPPTETRAAVLTRGSPQRRWADRPLERESLGSRLLLCLIVVGTTLPYYVCVSYTSWFIDEGFAITRNPDAKGLTPLLEVLRHDFWGTQLNPPEGYTTHKSFRPLVTLCYALEWQTAARLGWEGLEMKPMRLVSCVLHSITSVVVLWLLRLLKIPRLWALLGAALFATHPIHIENIVYLVGRADVLATLLSLLAAVLYMRMTCGSLPSLPLWAYGVLVALTATAGLCKEPGFTVLFFLACGEVVLRCRWRHVFGLLLCFATIGSLRIWYVGGTDAGFGYVDTPIRYQDHLLTRTLSYLYQHAYYAQLLVLPWNQSWDYSYDALPLLHAFDDVRMLAILTAYLLVAAVAAYGLCMSARRPELILGLGFVVIPFVPASNLFFLVGTTVGERLLYPCTVGWVVLLVAVGSSLRDSKRVAFAAMAVVLLCIYTRNSTLRMGHWRGPSELFETDAVHWSRSVKVVHSKASELQARGDLQGALQHYLRSLEIFDDQAITDYCIARILINLGRYQEAYARFDKILVGHGIGFHDGNDFLWMTDLGYVLVQLGSPEQGIHYLQQGLQRMPYSCYAWNALGVAQMRLQQLEAALQSLTEGLQCDPDSVSLWINLAVLYAYGNAPQQAYEALQRAVALDPARPTVVVNNRVLMSQGLPGEQPQMDLYIPYPGRR